MKFFVLGFLATLSAWAMPKKFEIWFLSPDQAQAAVLKLESKGALSFKPLAQASLQCQPMGDYCFDPQVGMYKPGDKPLDNAPSDYSAADQLEDYKYERKATGDELKNATCDKNNLFDIFCGQAKTSKKKDIAKFEIWFDISSSMKQVDFPGFDKMCQRESFLRLLARDCSFNEEMQIHGFNEAKKQLGTIDSVCLNHGLNNRERIIRDIKASNAKHLIVITDIYEAEETLLNFVETSGAGSVKGVEKPLYAGDLKSLAGDLLKKCL